VALLVTLIVGLAACRPSTRNGDSGTEGLQLFDTVVRADVVFPDAAQRALYKEVPVQTIRGARVYGFELQPQPGMQPNRHFHIVSAAVSRVDERVDAGPEGVSFGPNGGFWEKAVRTADGRYEIRMSEGMLLPDSAKVPEFDLGRAAEAISSRYRGLSAGR
jgi:hypothetical protein